MKEILEIIREAERRPNERFALATLVHARGSSYRRPGARMLVARDGEFVGSLSAGCLEEEVAKAALDVIDSGEPRLMQFDTRRRFGCDGCIEILIERVDNAFLFGLTRHLVTERRPSVIATTFRADAGGLGSRIMNDVEPMSDGVFVQEFHPAIRAIVIGNDADSAPLLRLAELVGWESSIICNITEWNFEADPWTAVIVKTHNYGRDCAVLRHVLPLSLRYVGLMGPRRRRDELLNDLLDSGVTIASELFAPAGIHLAADSSEEIALSVVAEIQAVFTHASCLPLRERKAPIHESQFLPATSPS